MNEKLKDIEETLKKTHSQLGKILKLAKECSRLYENPIDNAYKIDSLTKKLKEIVEKIDFDKTFLIESISPLKDAAEKLKEDFKFEFGRELEKELKSKGFGLRGQFPTLYTNFYTIKTDFQTGKAVVSFGPETLKTGIKLKPEELALSIEQIDNELKHNILEQEELLKKIYGAWERTNCRNRPSGLSTPIIEVLGQLVFLIQPKKFFINPVRRNFIEYSRAKFGYDLYRLKETNATKINGKELSLITATFDATAKKEGYIWVPINERGDGTTYSYMSFR